MFLSPKCKQWSHLDSAPSNRKQHDGDEDYDDEYDGDDFIE